MVTKVRYATSVTVAGTTAAASAASAQMRSALMRVGSRLGEQAKAASVPIAAPSYKGLKEYEKAERKETQI